MATDLSSLIATKQGEKTTLEGTIGSGEAAKAALAEVTKELDTLDEILALRDTALARADAMVVGSQAAIAPLQASPGYTAVDAGVAARLAAKGKTEAGMAGVVGATLPMSGTYASYVAALTAADTTLADDVVEEASRRVTLDARRAMIELRIAALDAYARGIESRFGQAKALLATATMAAQTNRVAAAWWAFHHVKALLADVTAASITPRVTSVSAACDDYAAAYDDWLTAHADLEASIADRADAAADLAQADAETLTALATFVG